MLRRVCPAAAVAVALFAVATTPAAAAGCPPLDYAANLAAAAAALGTTPPGIAAAESDVAQALRIAPDAGAVLAPVTADLDGSPPAVGDARLRLSSLSSTLAHPAGSVCNDSAAAARTALRGVYASPDFRHLDETPSTNWLDSVLGFLGRLLRAGAGALGPLGSLLLAIAVVGGALALAYRRWRRDAALPGAVVDEPATRGDDPDEEWRAAEHAATAGDYREAVRRAFRSALLEVATRGRVHLDAAWTTREMLSRCQAEGDVLVALAAAAALFDRAWYSGLSVGADDWVEARDRCAALRQLARRARAAPR